MTLVPLLLVTLATLQPAAPAQAPAPSDAARSADAVPAPPLLSGPEACPAEADYLAGFDALVAGRDKAALAALERVMTACPQHPYAGELARLARARLNPGARLAQATVAELGGPEAPSGGARASLAIVQTLHGIAQGILLCVIADCDTRAGVAVSLLGGGAGAAASMLLTKGGLTSGQAAAINSGTLWGFGYGAASQAIFDLQGDDSIAAVMFSALGFTGLGILVAELANPTAGQVSMANSGGLWAGTVTALFLATLDNGDTDTFLAIEEGVVGAGILSLALLSRNVPVSRGRMLLIDAGGILGGLLGASALFIIDENSGDAILVSAGVGALAGLGAATLLTRDFDAPDAPQVTVAPAMMGRHGGAGLALLGRF
jgi:hypothetical protein